MIVELWYAANLADRELDTPRARLYKGSFADYKNTDEEWLEEIYALFNRGSGREHPEMERLKLRSLSVSDIVVLRDSPGGTNPRFYYCEPFGWKRVEHA